MSTRQDGRRGRWLVWLAGLIVVVAAVAATAHGLYVVALGSGTTAGIAWLYPVITDGLALVAYGATTRLTGPARRYAWTVVVLAAGLSGLAQAVYLSGALPQPGADVAPAPSAVRFGVGAWPAVAAAIAAHLLFLIGNHHSPHPVDTHESTEPVPPRPVPASDVPVRSAEHGTWDADARPAPVVAPGTASPTALPGAAQSSQLGAPMLALELGHGLEGRRVLSQSDRARVAAERHAARTGSLPTVRELAELADVGRGTADRALAALRVPTNGHLAPASGADAAGSDENGAPQP
jgi:hypothetical protein